MQTESADGGAEDGSSSGDDGAATGGTGGGGIKLDAGSDTEGIGCASDASCDLIDLLFVIDNSGTMGEEQLNLARNLPLLVEQLQSLKDAQGNQINPSVNIMVTTTDMGHPLCTPFQKPGYQPQQGAPVYEGCNGRIARFTGLDIEEPLQVPEACTQNCPVDIAPSDQLIHFDATRTNVPSDDVAAALSCVGPQGIDGCGYEAPLESMLQALNPTACWNAPSQEHCENDSEWSQFRRGFLRPDATLAIAIITDEADCSVAPPGGFTYFTSDDTYWMVNPDLDIPQATSAVCWNSGVSCVDNDGDGVYESCTSADNDSLHPISRYVEYLTFVKEQQGKEVLMLGVVGVPPVTAHNDKPPFEPTEGGVNALVYRDWRDGEYDGTDAGGDILPAEWVAGVTADQKRFEFGAVGPGCTGTDREGNFTGQAIPPVWLREVCESLNYTDADGVDQVRCCMESICDDDFSPAIQCLAGIIQETIGPAG